MKLYWPYTNWNLQALQSIVNIRCRSFRKNFFHVFIISLDEFPSHRASRLNYRGTTAQGRSLYRQCHETGHFFIVLLLSTIASVSLRYCCLQSYTRTFIGNPEHTGLVRHIQSLSHTVRLQEDNDRAQQCTVVQYNKRKSIFPSNLNPVCIEIVPVM